MRLSEITPSAPPPLDTLRFITGKVSLLMRLTEGVSTSSGKLTAFTALSMSRCASFISIPKSKVAITTAKLALDVDSS